MSLNHAYQNVWLTDHNGRRYKGRKRTPEAERYFNDAVLLIRAAKPSHWAPTGYLRVIYDLFLARSIDADNVLKVLSDALERATGINDERMLPCVWYKETGLSVAQARVHIEVQPVSSWQGLTISRSLLPPSGNSSTASRRAQSSFSEGG